MALDAQWSAVARGYRFALILAFVLGAAAVVACTLTGYALAGMFITRGQTLPALAFKSDGHGVISTEGVNGNRI